MRKINILKITNILFLLASFSFSSVIFATSDAHDLEMGTEDDENRPLLEEKQSACKTFLSRQDFRRNLSMRLLSEGFIEACKKKTPIMSDFVADGSKLAALCAATYAGLKLLGGEDGINPSIAFIAGPILAGMAQTTLSNFGNNLLLLTCPILASPGLRKVSELDYRYAQIKAHFSEEMRRWFEAHRNRYKFNIQYYHFAFKELETALELALELPLKPKKLDPNSETTLKKFEEIKKLLSTYPASVQRSMVHFVSEILDLSMDESPTRRVTPIVLVGEPGTGKTFLVHKILEILKLPMFVCNPIQYRQLGGTNLWSNDSEKGLILDALSFFSKYDEEKPSNGVLVFDEIDKILAFDKNGTFLNPNANELLHMLYGLLETQTLKTSIKYFDNADFPTKHLSIVLIVNKRLAEVLKSKPTMAKPLVERTDEVFFEGYQSEEKKKIALQAMKQFQEKNPSIRDLEESVILEIVQQDESQGVRQMLIILFKYFNYVKNNSYWSKMTDLEQQTFNPEEEYKSLKRAQPEEEEKSKADHKEEGGADKAGD